MSKGNERKIRVNTRSLKACADRLDTLNRQTESLKSTLEAACAASGMPELLPALHTETLTEGAADVERCVRYLRETAEDFEALERELAAKL
jgi:hypothetical protein